LVGDHQSRRDRTGRTAARDRQRADRCGERRRRQRQRDGRVRDELFAASRARSRVAAAAARTSEHMKRLPAAPDVRHLTHHRASGSRSQRVVRPLRRLLAIAITAALVRWAFITVLDPPWLIRRRLPSAARVNIINVRVVIVRSSESIAEAERAQPERRSCRARSTRTPCSERWRE
jgi:hypothetical protein